MKKNIFKKAGRVFTSLALAVSIWKTKTSIIAIIFIL